MPSKNLKMKLLAVLVMLLGGACFSGCAVVVGSGDLIEVRENYRDFNRLEIRSAFKVNVKQGTEFDIAVQVDDNLRAFLDIKQDRDTLKIGLVGNVMYQNAHLSATITMPALHHLKVSGASIVKVDGVACDKALGVEVSGASDVGWSGRLSISYLEVKASGASVVQFSDIDVAGTSDFRLSGASRLLISGVGKDIDLRASGASKASLLEFANDAAHARLSGASKAELHVATSLSVDASGASQVLYLGNPRLDKVQTSGASEVQPYRKN